MRREPGTMYGSVEWVSEGRLTSFLSTSVHSAIETHSYHLSPVNKLIPVGLEPPQKIVGPLRDQTDRDLPRTNGVGVALAYGAYATVY